MNRKMNLRVETLENRWVPACVVSILDGGHTLQITGDGADNVVSIVQKDNTNDLIVTCDGVETILTSSDITKMKVDLKGGADTFGWGLHGSSNMSHGKKLFLKTGGGDDFADFRLWHAINDHAVLLSSIKIDADMGNGNDEVWASFGQKHGGSLDLDVKLNDGDDKCFQALWGDVSGGADVMMDMLGGTGNDTISSWNTYDNKEMWYGNVDVTGDSTLAINVLGEDGADKLSATYAGSMDGKLTMFFDGGKHDDVIDLNKANNNGVFFDASSSGQADIQVKGGSGNDNLNLSITEAAGSDVELVNAILNGGTGSDTYNWIATTNNVDVSNCEVAVPVIIVI